MKTKNQRNRGKQGTTLVEMLAAVIIVSIVVVGVLQFLIISRLNIYTANIRGGMVQLLSDTIVQNQFIPPGTITNVPVTGTLPRTYPRILLTCGLPSRPPRRTARTPWMERCSGKRSGTATATC